MAQDEKATLIVGGKKFEDWESVWVQQTWGDAFHQFRFTAAERDPTPQLYALLQLRPGDECIIELAGELAITGIILTRQAAYDPNSHGVMLQGVSMSWAAARASIIHETGSFDGKHFMQIAEEVLRPTEVKARTHGEISKKIFERMQVNPGEPIFNFLERIGRERKIIVACDKDGNFLFVGEHESESLGALVEGQNIRACQCVISEAAQHSEYILRGQTAASNDQNMRQPAEQEARETGKLKPYSPIIVPMEQPVWTLDEVKQRAKNELMWTEAQRIQATFVVQGWTAGNGKLWEPGKNVSVKSKMAMLDMDLSIQSATFTQDNASGSLTSLLCVAPWGLNGKSDAVMPSGSPGARPSGIGHN